MKILHVLYTFTFLAFSTADQDCNDEQDANCRQARLRTRRDVKSSGSCSAGEKTPEQASSLLEGKTQLAVNVYNESTMTKKREFLSAAKNVIPALCNNMTVGSEPPLSASSSLADLQVQRSACNNTATSLRSIPCNACSNIAKYQVTERILLNNKRWNCSQGSNDSRLCDGLCIGSLRMPNDLLTNSSSGCRSHIVYVNLFNPTTSQPVTVFAGNDSAMTVQIEYDNDNKGNQSYKCFLWTDDDQRWDGTLCNLTLLPRKSNNVPHVAQCKCTRLGSACVAFADTDMNSPSGNLWLNSNSSGNESEATTTVEPATEQSGNQSNNSSSAGGSEGTTAAPTSGSNGGSGGESGSNNSSSAEGSGGTTAAPTSGSNGGPGGESGSNNQGGSAYVSLTFDGDCKTIINTSNEQPFVTQIKTQLQQSLELNENQITDVKFACGSIIITMTIVNLNSSTLAGTIKNIGTAVSASGFIITLPDGSKWKPVGSLVGLGPGNVTSFIPVPTASLPTTRKRYELVFNYKPIMLTVALGLTTVIFCVCCTFIVHSCWLRKNKFTKYNSMTAKEYADKMKIKEAKNRLNEVEEVNEFPLTTIGVPRKVAPATNFDMTNETMPKLNETSFTNYDWARTSYLPGMMAQPYAVNEDVDEPRLILDTDSDSDGEENEGFDSDEDLSPPGLPRAVSHMSLEKDSLAKLKSNDTLKSRKSLIAVPPIYDNIVDNPGQQTDDNSPEQRIYDNVAEMNPNGPPPPTPLRPEPQYTTID